MRPGQIKNLKPGIDNENNVHPFIVGATRTRRQGHEPDDPRHSQADAQRVGLL